MMKRTIGLLIVVLPTLAFLIAAVTRRLNFDEALALHAGWLLVERVPATPDFYMPVTVLLGWLSHKIIDPGSLFFVTRLLVGLTVLGSLYYAYLNAKLDKGVFSLAFLFCLLQAGFSVHAYEFRYDWAILCGWLLAFVCLLNRRKTDFILLGFCFVLLLTHHLKGVFHASFLYMFYWLVIILENKKWRSHLLLFHGSALALLVSWILISVMSGHGRDITSVYQTFLSLSSEQEKVWPWVALHKCFAKDIVWWWVAGISVIICLVKLSYKVRRIGLIDSAEFWSILFAFVPVLFIFIHPHPWPYMLSLPAPFLAIVIASTLVFMWQRKGGYLHFLAIIFAGVIILYAVNISEGIWPGSPYLAAVRAPNHRQVQTLRFLRQEAGRDDRIIDPTGMVYFMKPCTREWYVDTLFSHYAMEGKWMGELEKEAADCTWLLNTYRLNMLPSHIKETIKNHYIQMNGPVLINKNNDEPRHLPKKYRLQFNKISNFWWCDS
ncbi:MAG: hypothetical protein GY847_12440 [Proteobacteria bacterium]|nr:hypothetical protein [Pseudomonadota bacterium]